jgi:hypothetical protein
MPDPLLERQRFPFVRNLPRFLVVCAFVSAGVVAFFAPAGIVIWYAGLNWAGFLAGLVVAVLTGLGVVAVGRWWTGDAKWLG